MCQSAVKVFYSSWWKSLSFFVEFPINVTVEKNSSFMFPHFQPLNLPFSTYRKQMILVPGPVPFTALAPSLGERVGHRRAPSPVTVPNQQVCSRLVSQAEARLAAKRAARAEARDIRMRELERQQKEVHYASSNLSYSATVFQTIWVNWVHFTPPKRCCHHKSSGN